jgi:hypothetical protein
MRPPSKPPHPREDRAALSRLFRHRARPSIGHRARLFFSHRIPCSASLSAVDSINRRACLPGVPPDLPSYKRGDSGRERGAYGCSDKTPMQADVTASATLQLCHYVPPLAQAASAPMACQHGGCKKTSGPQWARGRARTDSRSPPPWMRSLRGRRVSQSFVRWI